MKIIINTTNLVKGGGIQVALSFLYELQVIGNHKYIVFLSSSIASQLDLDAFPGNFKFYKFEYSPSKIQTRRVAVRRFDKIVKMEKPDVVFTIFGPSYWRPKVPHVMGFALPWLINPESRIFENLNFKEKIKIYIKNIYKSYYVVRDADYYVVETPDVKNRLSEYLKIDSRIIDVVPNTFSKVYDNSCIIKRGRNINDHFTFVTISANYFHKNLDILNKVIPILRENNVSCKFILTIPQAEFEKKFKIFDDYIVNLGPVKIAECPAVYSQADALFLPTLLECFSASYPEAMRMNLPILTSDLGFARSICRDAALYFDPQSPSDIVMKIQEIISNFELRKLLVEKGKIRLLDFPSAKRRAELYLSTCKTVSEKSF